MGASHLGAAHADDAIDVPIGIVEEGHGDSMLAGGDPVPLGGWVNLEDMRPGTENGLLPGERHGTVFITGGQLPPTPRGGTVCPHTICCAGPVRALRGLSVLVTESPTSTECVPAPPHKKMILDV